MKGKKMSDFKVGDRVKYISKDYYSFDVGTVGTVIEINKNYKTYKVRLDNKVSGYGNNQDWYFPIWALSLENSVVKTNEIDVTINISDTEEIDVTYENFQNIDIPDLLKAIKVAFPKATSAVFVVNL